MLFARCCSEESFLCEPANGMSNSPSTPSAEVTAIPSLAELTAGYFQPFVNQQFELHYGPDQSEPLELVSATTSGRPYRQGVREPFSLIFRARTREFYVPQALYPIVHPGAGEHTIFIVPIGPDDAGMQFQAVFN